MSIRGVGLSLATPFAVDDGVTLWPLSLTAASLNEHSAADTVVGTVVGARSGSTLSLTDTAGGRFKLVAGVVKADTVATDYASARSHNITIRETKAGAPGDPTQTILTISVVHTTTTYPAAYVPALAL